MTINPIPTEGTPQDQLPEGLVEGTPEALLFETFQDITKLHPLEEGEQFPELNGLRVAVNRDPNYPLTIQISNRKILANMPPIFQGRESGHNFVVGYISIRLDPESANNTLNVDLFGRDKSDFCLQQLPSFNPFYKPHLSHLLELAKSYKRLLQLKIIRENQNSKDSERWPQSVYYYQNSCVNGGLSFITFQTAVREDIEKAVGMSVITDPTTSWINAILTNINPDTGRLKTGRLMTFGKDNTPETHLVNDRKAEVLLTLITDIAAKRAKELKARGQTVES